MAEVFFAAADVVDPLHRPADNRAAFPFDVCYRGLAPGEGRIVVSADEGDVVWDPQTSVGERVIGCIEEERFVDNERGGRSGAEKGVKNSAKSFPTFLPVREMEFAGLNFGVFEGIQKCLFQISGLGEASLFPAEESDAAMAQLQEMPCGLEHGGSFVWAGGGDGESATPAEESECRERLF